MTSWCFASRSPYRIPPARSRRVAFAICHRPDIGHRPFKSSAGCPGGKKLLLQRTFPGGPSSHAPPIDTSKRAAGVCDRPLSPSINPHRLSEWTVTIRLDSSLTHAINCSHLNLSFINHSLIGASQCPRPPVASHPHSLDRSGRSFFLLSPHSHFLPLSLPAAFFSPLGSHPFSLQLLPSLP